MVILKQIKRKNQLTIPSAILKRIGVKAGDYVAVEDSNGRIILNPRRIEERGLDDSDWEKLDKLVRQQKKKRQYNRFANFDDAIKSLKIKKE